MRKIGWIVGVVLVLGLLGSFGWRALRANTNPILIISDDPQSEVLLDLKPIKFEDGVYRLNPWKDSYLLEVRGHGKSKSAVIFPNDSDSDSGSVVVEKDKVEFHLKYKGLRETSL